MFLSEQFRRWFSNGAHKRRRPTARDVETFIEQRRENLSRLTPEEIERLSQDALAKIDKEKTLREADALRERWKVQPTRGVPHNTE